jgi:hypothetical protein
MAARMATEGFYGKEFARDGFAAFAPRSSHEDISIDQKFSPADFAP